MMPIEVAMVAAMGQGIACLGAVFAAAGIFMSRGDAIEIMRKATSRGLFVMAIGMLIELLATISLIVIPGGGS